MPQHQSVVFAPSCVQYAPVPQEAPHGSIGYWDLSCVDQGDYKAFVWVSCYAQFLLVRDTFCRQCQLDEALSAHFHKVKLARQQGDVVLWYYDATASQQAIYEPVIQKIAALYQEHELLLPYKETRGNKHRRIVTTLSHLFHHKRFALCGAFAGHARFGTGFGTNGSVFN